MYIFPVCGKKSKTETGICTSCRFDRSRNYEAYATISPLKGNNNHAISKKKQNYESKQRPGAFACSKCKSIRFHIFPQTDKILYVDCGTEIRQEELPWKQPEQYVSLDMTIFLVFIFPVSTIGEKIIRYDSRFLAKNLDKPS